MPKISVPETQVTDYGDRWRTIGAPGGEFIVDKGWPGLVVVPDPPTIEDGAYADCMGQVWVRDHGRWWSSSLQHDSQMTDWLMAHSVLDGAAWRLDLSKPKETP